MTPLEEAPRWRGATAEERRILRRDRLIAACAELLAEGGTGDVGVRAVCRRSKLTERYFYESYANVEELIADTFRQSSERLNEAMRIEMDLAEANGESKIAASMRASVEYLSADPARMRLFLLAAERELTDPNSYRAEESRLAYYREIFESVQPVHTLSPVAVEANVRALVGAMTQLFVGWTSGQLKMSQEEFIVHTDAVASAISAVRTPKTNQ